MKIILAFTAKKEAIWPISFVPALSRAMNELQFLCLDTVLPIKGSKWLSPNSVQYSEMCENMETHTCKLTLYQNKLNALMKLCNIYIYVRIFECYNHEKNNPDSIVFIFSESKKCLDMSLCDHNRKCFLSPTASIVLGY